LLEVGAGVGQPGNMIEQGGIRHNLILLTTVGHLCTSVLRGITSTPEARL
jgi:hypothetical protein